MDPAIFQFSDFTVDTVQRQLKHEGTVLELNSRYLDALILLLEEPGQLISKDRFLQKVWDGIPVTEEALTQCIKTIRKTLGDNARRPRFIETVPKHGYRFIAPMKVPQNEAAPLGSQNPDGKWDQIISLGATGTAGAGVAGIIGGMLCGLSSASMTQANGAGTLSTVAVLLSFTVLVTLIGGLGVSFGIAFASLAKNHAKLYKIAGGAIGGMLVGAFTKLLGLDAIQLLFGNSPDDITGAYEGLILGAAVGLCISLAHRFSRPSKYLAVTAIFGVLAGLLIHFTQGKLLGGSLLLLANSFPDSSLQLVPIHSGITAALESALFTCGITGAVLLVKC